MENNISISKWPAILTGVVIAFATAFFLVIVFFMKQSQSQRQFANEIFNILSRIDQDLMEVLVPLNALGHQACTEENLKDMEALLFDAVYAKHVMFYIDNAGVCSTGSGILENPIIRPPPDFVGTGNLGVEVWVSRNIILELTGKPFTAIIVKQGNYSIMLDPAILTPNVTAPFNWIFFFRDLNNSKNIYILGNEALLDAHSQQLTDNTSYILKQEVCAQDFPTYCLVLATTTEELLGNYTEVISLMLTFSLALGYIWTVRVDKKIQSNVQVPARVVKGFNGDAYYWHCQPLVDLDTQKIIGCEILARFRDKYGDIPPYHFLPAIREAGLTSNFTQHMINTVLPELEKNPAFPEEFKVSLNIFPYDIVSGGINDFIALPALTNSRFKIALEITEDEHLDEQVAQDNLKKVHDSNLEISIDDFGTGFSNLKQIRKLNSTYLKIDRSYVLDLEKTPIRSSLIPHIVNMAAQLKLKVIAEGIETAEQLSILKELHVAYGQGWLFGKPMPVSDLATLLDKQKR